MTRLEAEQLVLEKKRLRKFEADAKKLAERIEQQKHLIAQLQEKAEQEAKSIS